MNRAPDYLALATKLLQGRRKRDAIFADDCIGFGEPAWDMLLSLFVADESGEPLESSVVVSAAPSALSVSRRYLQWMIDSQLAEDADGRVSLTERGRTLMLMYLALEQEA